MTEYEIKRKREYHRKWRQEHKESVRAAQLRYWIKKVEKIKNDSEGTNSQNAEIC